MKTTWAKREIRRSTDFQASVHTLYESVRARYKDDFAKAGFIRRIILRYRITAEFNKEMTKEVEI